MCGINGILRLRDAASPIDRDELVRTRDYMEMRGPDGAREWISPSGTIGLGHRRLAIIDLSPAGTQPMAWENGRYQITFNGEIYNYQELRRQLTDAGVVLKTHSDTEVILALYAQEGVAMFSRLRGMYAFAIWDNYTSRLLLARDPFGIKPLYYSADGNYFRFASQVKALQAGGAISRAPDPAGIVGFLLWGSVPEPFTICRSIRALPAGHYMMVEQNCVQSARSHYDWNTPVASDQADLQTALINSVAYHLVADVPVGIFLSGGLDSTLVTALACRLLPEPPLTFTIGFDSFVGKPHDELPLANMVAKKLGTRHIERRIHASDFPNLWSNVLKAMDRPSIDGFNVYVVSQIARAEGIKVALTGLGGDELFGSYPSFKDIPRWTMWTKRLKRIPGLEAIWPPLVSFARWRQPKLKALLKYGNSMAGAYFLRRGLYLPDELPALVGCEVAQEGLAAYDPISSIETLLAGARDSSDTWKMVHALETSQYLRNQLLREADWAPMAHGLELRVPLVDIRLSEYMTATDFESVRSKSKSEIVRQIAPELPQEIYNRPKSGFLFPVMEWLEPVNKSGSSQWGKDSRHIALRVLDEFLQN